MKLPRTNEPSERSRRVIKKPRCYKDEYDGCIDTWIEMMKLHFEEEDLSERQESSYQQPGRDSPKLCDDQKAITAGYC